MVERREARKGKMTGKEHVDNLPLGWSGSSHAENSQTERDIIDEIQPNTNIKEVKITIYSQ